MNGLEIIPYSDKYREDVIFAIGLLKEHEFKTSDARIAPSDILNHQCYDELMEEIKQKVGEVFIAIQDSEFAGFVSYSFEYSYLPYDTAKKHALISNICVLPKFRGIGIAQQLLKFAECEVRKKGFHGRIRVWVLADNESAVKSYIKYGFKPLEIIYEK
jgi:ribosomal protein S18 acetylase RimI-like enzyme